MKNHKVRYKNNLSYDMVDFFKRKSVYIVVIRQPTEIYEMFICLLSDISCQNKFLLVHIHIPVNS